MKRVTAILMAFISAISARILCSSSIVNHDLPDPLIAIDLAFTTLALAGLANMAGYIKRRGPLEQTQLLALEEETRRALVLAGSRQTAVPKYMERIYWNAPYELAPYRERLLK